MNDKDTKIYTITKKISKHGKQSVIVIPSFLQDELKPKTIVEVRINIIREARRKCQKFLDMAN